MKWQKKKKKEEELQERREPRETILWRVWISPLPEKRFVQFRVGSTHTDISLHARTALRHSHEGMNNATASERYGLRGKVCDCEKV